MILNLNNDNLKITEYNENDYNNIIKLLYGLNVSLKFKDNNKYNLKKDNVIVISKL
jgi:hypothetical protein